MTVSDHLKHLEETLLSPAVRKDHAQLSSLLARDFREIGSSGRTFSRSEILEELPAESPLPTIILYDFQCSMLSDTLALVTYRTARTTTPEAKPIVALRSSLWTLRDDRWQILFHQGTRVP